MEQGIKILIYMHAASGGLALLGGLISIIATKGGKLHRKSGLVFFYSMLFSGITAMLVAVLPSHENPFLFAVGVFSSYFVLTGYRALRFKTKVPSLKIDKLIAIIMLITGVLMIFLPIISISSINIVLTAFGIVGIIFSVKDLMLFKKPERLRRNWLKMHIGKMFGGYISATTAFIVVNQFLPGIYGWLAPGVIGGFIIAYWTRKVNKTKTTKNVEA